VKDSKHVTEASCLLVEKEARGGALRRLRVYAHIIEVRVAGV